MHFVDLFAKFSRRVLPKRRICLVYWRPPTGTNFGDEMSWHVVARLLERYGKSAVALEPCTGQRRYACRVLAIGSILHLARDGDIVWGSGLNGKIGVSGYDFSAIQFRAVRGPLTREFVQRNGGVCPEIYGDPGLLVPALFPELLSERRAGEQYAVSYLPNINDAATGTEHSAGSAHTIQPTTEWQQVVRGIASSGFLASSSLHGLVLADALGVPCRPLVSLFEAPFKYEDYYLGTGRAHIRYARTVDEALALGPVAAPKLELDRLRAAFPVEAF